MSLKWSNWISACWFNSILSVLPTSFYKVVHFMYWAKTTWRSNLCSRGLSVLSDFIVFSENVLSANFNRMRDWCETMETNQTKTLLAESLEHNYSAASTFILLFFSLVSVLSSLPLRNVAVRCHFPPFYLYSYIV